MRISTIGFTKTSAENFFQRLLRAEVVKVVDVRLQNTSQLSGFAKAKDLEYFLKNIGGIQYVHLPLLAPTEKILREYKNKKVTWDSYEAQYWNLISERKIEQRINPEMLDGACLLCSEATPHHCHRRLVCEYLNEKWDVPLKVTHL